METPHFHKLLNRWEIWRKRCILLWNLANIFGNEEEFLHCNANVNVWAKHCTFSTLAIWKIGNSWNSALDVACKWQKAQYSLQIDNVSNTHIITSSAKNQLALSTIYKATKTLHSCAKGLLYVLTSIKAYS